MNERFGTGCFDYVRDEARERESGTREREGESGTRERERGVEQESWKERGL